MISTFNKFYESINLTNHQAKKIVIVLAVATLLTVFGVFLFFNQTKPIPSWVKAEGAVPQRVWQALLSEKRLDKNQILVLKITDVGAGNLYVIDFNTSQLCGAGGCLYTVYTQSGKSVLSLLLNPNLPKGNSLFAVDKVAHHGFYCLAIAQSNRSENTIVVARYCYEGTGFVLVNSSVTQGEAR